MAIIAGGAADADDLAQDAWVTGAGARGPRPGRSPRPWFVRVMHNFRRMQARGDARRRAREEVVLAVVAESPAPRDGIRPAPPSSPSTAMTWQGE